MTEDLLIKEKEFRQLNKELERKAHDLVRKVDHVINTYNNGYLVRNSEMQDLKFMYKKAEISENTVMRKEESSQISIKRNISLPHIFDQDFSSKLRTEVQKSYKDKGSKKENLANETIIDLFKAKIDVLQNELQIIHVEYKKKCDSYKNLESEYKRFETKSQNEIEYLKDTVTKLENTNRVLKCHSVALTNENLVIKKDLDKLQKQIKALTQQSSSQGSRLNRSLESNDKLKNTLKCCKIEEKELRNQIRKLYEDKRSMVNNLGKQLSELVHIFKKQMLFIDNLKKQNACLMVIKQLNFIKEDFSRLLDQKI